MADICSNESLYQFLAQSFISFYPSTENPLKRHFCGFLAALSVTIFQSRSLIVKKYNKKTGAICFLEIKGILYIGIVNSDYGLKIHI